MCGAAAVWGAAADSREAENRARVGGGGGERAHAREIPWRGGGALKKGKEKVSKYLELLTRGKPKAKW